MADVTDVTDITDMADNRYRVVPAGSLTPDEVEAWSQMQSADRSAGSPFLRPEYAAAIAAVRDDTEVTVIERGDTPVGFFPFHREKERIGWALGYPMSDLNGVIAAPGLEWGAEELLRRSGLSTWHFDHLVASQAPFQRHHAWIDESPYMDLSRGYAAYQEERSRAGSSQGKQGLRKARKLAREIGPLRFEFHTPDRAVVNRLIEWKQRQLIEAHQADVFRWQWLHDLIDGVVEARAEAFSGLLSALYAGDNLVSAHLGIRSRGVLASWIPTYDPAFGSYSPGLILHLELARRAADEGIERLDLGRGENQLKTGLASGAVLVAVGTVELRRLHRWRRRALYGTRRLVYASPHRRRLVKLYRRTRLRLASRS